jgi:hypothetical protein
VLCGTALCAYHTLRCACCAHKHTQSTPLLAERFFGSRLELTSHDNYCPFWAGDAADAGSTPPGCEDGESVVQVAQRLTRLLTVRARVPGAARRSHARLWAT